MVDMYDEYFKLGSCGDGFYSAVQLPSLIWTVSVSIKSVISEDLEGSEQEREKAMFDQAKQLMADVNDQQDLNWNPRQRSLHHVAWSSMWCAFRGEIRMLVKCF